MRIDDMGDSVLIGGVAPANWIGQYSTDDEPTDPVMVWYNDAHWDTFPHFTVTTTMPHEVSPGSREWVGFHISVPHHTIQQNARFNYVIVNGVPEFSNMSAAGIRQEVMDFGRAIPAVNLNNLALAFHSAMVALQTARTAAAAAAAVAAAAAAADAAMYEGISRLFPEPAPVATAAKKAARPSAAARRRKAGAAAAAATTN